MNSFIVTLHGLAVLVDQTPEPQDVKAGWGAFAIFLGMAAAVALLGWSLVRHLRKAQRNADAGAFAGASGSEDDQA